MDIEEAMRRGKDAFKIGIGSALALNKEFIKRLPTGRIGSDTIFKIRIKLYSAYSKGWHLENLKRDK